MSSGEIIFGIVLAIFMAIFVKIMCVFSSMEDGPMLRGIIDRMKRLKQQEKKKKRELAKQKDIDIEWELAKEKMDIEAYFCGW